MPAQTYKHNLLFFSSALHWKGAITPRTFPVETQWKWMEAEKEPSPAIPKENSFQLSSTQAILFLQSGSNWAAAMLLWNRHSSFQVEFSMKELNRAKSINQPIALGLVNCTGHCEFSLHQSIDNEDIVFSLSFLVALYHWYYLLIRVMHYLGYFTFNSESAIWGLKQLGRFQDK